jgi:isochorismate synthase
MTSQSTDWAEGRRRTGTTAAGGPLRDGLSLAELTTATGPDLLAGWVHESTRRAQRAANQHRAPVLFSSVLPLPFRPNPLALFTLGAGFPRAYWEQPDEGFSLVAIGAAQELSSSGESRFAGVSAQWRDLLDTAVVEGDAACPVAAPVCLGGFAFDPARDSGEHWREFAAASLLVPQLLLVSQRGGSWLVLTLATTPGCGLREPDAGAVALGLGAADPIRTEAPGGDDAPPMVAGGGQAADWQAVVGSVIQEIRAGAAEKVVLAREARLRATRPFDPAAVLGRLRARFGACTVFAFSRGERCFLGATPERLVRLDGDILRVTGLAGSAPRGSTEIEDAALGTALLADPKERREHALVVEALRAALAPVCTRLEVPASPSLLKMTNVQHLQTLLTGTVSGRRNLLELVARLHPTPAVGGVPRDAAVALIRRYEPFGRGWYAAPVGWMDGRGNGEFVVALRSALLHGSEAWLYAGCGILSDSDPAREYEESCLKLQPMRWALSSR